MKESLRSLFSPILRPLESGSGAYGYKPSHRKVLIVMGVLFTLLASAIVVLAQGNDVGYLFPAIVFGAVGVLALIVGSLGDDRAVAKIWGNQQGE